MESSKRKDQRLREGGGEAQTREQGFGKAARD